MFEGELRPKYIAGGEEVPLPLSHDEVVQQQRRERDAKKRREVEFFKTMLRNLAATGKTTLGPDFIAQYGSQRSFKQAQVELALEKEGKLFSPPTEDDSETEGD